MIVIITWIAFFVGIFVSFVMEYNGRCKTVLEYLSDIQETFERKIITIKIAIWLGT